MIKHIGREGKGGSLTESNKNRLATLSRKERIGYGLGDMGFNFYWAIIGSYLVFFYTDIFGISAAAAATMVTVTKVIDAFTDPAVGALADRTQTRWGKFRPYLLFGAIPMMAAGILTMTTPDIGETGKLIWAYATYALMMLTYTFLNIPYSSLSGVLSADGRERNKINSTRFFFAYFSSIIVGAATPDIAAYFGGGDINSARGWQITMAIYAVIASCLFLVTFFTTTERVEPPKDQIPQNPLKDLRTLFLCRPWLVLFLLALVFMVTMTLRGSSAPYYFKYYLARMDLLGAYIGLQFFGLMLGALAAGYVTKFIDKKKLLMTTLIIVGALSIVMTFIPEPDHSGVVQINPDTPAAIEASDLLNTDVTGPLVWESHEKVFWIITRRAVLPVTSETLATAEYQNKTVSVKITGPAGSIIDSGKTPKEIWYIFVLNFLISIALGFKPPITWGMYADVADFNEWRTGRRATGMTFSGTTFSQKLGSAVGSASLLALLAKLGYEANNIQDGASVTGIIYMQTLIPGLLAFATAVTLIFYNLNQSKLEEIQLELAART